MEKKKINTLCQITAISFLAAGLVLCGLSILSDARELLPYGLGSIAASNFLILFFCQPAER
ncbi:MAG: hypothetical protein HUJ54_00600 [Erysipelotrichaceae bacterium]|nr:hypothetical protein [Erysipelotrichaceae bacterium]